jgi:glc operon protein GlcG
MAPAQSGVRAIGGAGGLAIIRDMSKLTTFFVATLLVAGSGRADAQMYGSTITVEMAKKAAAPALAEALKNKWTMAVAVVDTHGELVYFERMDDTQMGSVGVAIAKANSAARFKRPTKAFQEAVAAGGDGLRMLGLDGAVPVEGGVPLVVGGRIVGAIGASGGTSQQDGVVAAAGASALK